MILISEDPLLNAHPGMEIPAQKPERSYQAPTPINVNLNLFQFSYYSKSVQYIIIYLVITISCPSGVVRAVLK